MNHPKSMFQLSGFYYRGFNGHDLLVSFSLAEPEIPDP